MEVAGRPSGGLHRLESACSEQALSRRKPALGLREPLTGAACRPPASAPGCDFLIRDGDDRCPRQETFSSPGQSTYACDLQAACAAPLPLQGAWRGHTRCLVSHWPSPEPDLGIRTPGEAAPECSALAPCLSGLMAGTTVRFTPLAPEIAPAASSTGRRAWMPSRMDVPGALGSSARPGVKGAGLSPAHPSLVLETGIPGGP
ncbi:hypothetical protein CapIbe_020352 [Capra ibex]